MTLKIFARILIFYTVYVHIHDLHAQVPNINTLFVPIGKLYPRSDFAGVLIDLNVNEAIIRGKEALEVTDEFLNYQRSRQKIGAWTGKDRGIHFIHLKRNKVKKNLQILEADLHHAHEQFRMPSTTGAQASQNNTSIRRKRGVNWDIELDVNKCLSTLVDGVVSLFSSPKSLDKIQKSVEKVSYRTSRLESKFINFTEKIDKILHWMRKDMEHNQDQLYMLASINSALDLADETIKDLLNSITPLVQGKLTHNLLDPLQARTLIDMTQQLADRHNLQVVVDQPVDILKCSVTTFATKDAWYALISIPLVYRSETMDAVQFINIPWFHNNLSVQWDFREGIVASTSGLFPDIKNIFVPMQDLEKVCEKFNNNYLCHKRINHFPTCQTSLLYNHTTACKLKLADPQVRYSFGSFEYLFFQEPTHSLVECPGEEKMHTIYHGLISFDQISRCKITTTKFTLLPKSPANSISTMVQKTLPIFILTNEWIKITIAFDKAEKKQNAIEPNPWKKIEHLSNQKEEVKLFGSHTILVHSIMMFLIVSLLLFLVTICVINFLNYTPGYFKSIPVTFGNSNPSIIAEDTAIPEEGDFTDVPERLVK
jgi:hypothetical protein